jgi:hypothetical protein
MSHYLQTCRFCGEQDTNGTDSMVKYGVRHHAHFACYLDAGKRLDALHAWQVGTFPYKVLKDRDYLAGGLLEEADRLTALKLEPLSAEDLLRVVRGESIR